MHLSGDLDLAARQPAVEQLRNLDLEPGHTLTLHVGGVTFCDSIGLLTLLEARRRTEANGGQLILRAVPEVVRELLELTDLATEFVIDA
jgi:anti-sigma B factor antagonist